MEKEQTIEQLLESQLDALKADPCAITEDSIEKLWTPAKEAKATLENAMDAYENDLKTRREFLDKQATELDGKIKALKDQIVVLEDQSRDAASRGDLDAAAAVDEQAEGLRKQLATATRKRRIASSTELKGDKELFAAVKAAHEADAEANALCRQYVREAVNTIAHWAAHFEKKKRETRYADSAGPSYYGNRFEKIDRHFNAEFYARIERETKERAKAEAEANRHKGAVFVMG